MSQVSSLGRATHFNFINNMKLSFKEFMKIRASMQEDKEETTEVSDDTILDQLIEDLESGKLYEAYEQRLNKQRERYYKYLQEE